MGIIDRFIKISEEFPANIAVHENQKNLTYYDLCNMAKKISYNIKKISRAPRVLIILPQGGKAYAAMFGTLFAGGYYSPCNIEAPIYKVQSILKIFKPTAIVSTKKLYKKFTNSLISPPPLVNVDNLEKIIKLTKLRTYSQKIAYVCFTSGSTGSPKGVIVSRKSLSAYIDWAVLNMNLSFNDRWSQHPNLSFDLSVLDIYGALSSGGTLFPLNSSVDRMMPAKAISKYGLTIWNSVPSVINMMIQAKQLTKTNLKSLRLATFCGEPLLRKHLESLFLAHKDIIVHNTYGPTEATVSMTLLKINKNMDFNKICKEAVALGKPIKNMGLYLIGGSNKKEGEIVITGPQVAKGYWKLPKETKKSFREIKIKQKKIKAYFTGDWAIKQNGHLFFKNRLDRQAKIKGFRIELEMIDSVIREYTKCLSESVVVKNKLYCFLECSKKNININNLIKNLKVKLEDYSIPNHFIFLKVFPRNQNDKIDLNKMVYKYINNID